MRLWSTVGDEMATETETEVDVVQPYSCLPASHSC
jgi:hypothetical protein